MKLKRGQKLCKNCNQINGARAHVCKHCNTEFVSGGPKTKNKTRIKKQKKFESVDWKALNVGDRIKVFGRSGNYYINDAGEKLYMSDPGIYTVQKLEENGMVVYNGDRGGYGYIYMGEETSSPYIDNMYRSPHKIMKYNPPTRPE